MGIQIFGLPVSRGVAIGRAVLVASSRVDVAHYFIDPSETDAQVDRLRRAIETVAGEIEQLKAGLPGGTHEELAALLDVHLMLVRDEELVGAAIERVRERHYNAEWALSAQLEILAREFDEMEDAYLRERKADVEQVVERLLAALGRDAAPLESTRLSPAARDFAGEDPLILVASDISPSDMLQFREGVFKGFVTDVGGRNSHTAIVARSMDVPAVVGAREASRLIEQDDWLVVDGDEGLVIVDPSPLVLEEYRFRQREDALERARLHRLRHMPALTLDGVAVELLANIELPSDAAVALDSGAVGVGLFRSEFLFLNRGGELPGEEEQFEAYRAVVMAMRGLPVTIRTVDVGADKPLDRASLVELRHEHLLNPALGQRAIRWSLSEPEMFGQQLRAILRASAYGKVRLMIPMLAQMSEVRQTLQAVRTARQQLEARGIAHATVEVGAMIEIPAAALILPTLLRHFDFVSIGTNDLIQYTLAIDRADESVSHLYDPWHPAVLKLIHDTIRQAHQAGKAVSVCGEMAGDPQFTELLLAMGLRSFSMHPAQIATLKQRVLRSEVGGLSELLRTALEDDDPEVAWERLRTAPQRDDSGPDEPRGATGLAR